MNILLIDGRGGLLGSQIIKVINEKFPEFEVVAIVTNAVATSAMIKAGAKVAAIGENPVIVACRKADVIIGPVGIVIADSLYGEVTPEMAVAVGQSDGVKILIPVNRCDNFVAGVTNTNVTDLIEDAMLKLQNIAQNRNCKV